VAALAEYHAEGAHLELPAAALAAPAGFARYVAALHAGVELPGELDRFVAALAGSAPPPPPEGGYAPQTNLWWVRGDEYLGRVAIRHHLTADLLRGGGHIGYEVRPGARRQGHATAMLAAALPIAASLGIGLAHLDCDVANRASRRVIEKNGGRLDREQGHDLFFLVPTSPAAPRPDAP
jgi:predicted acetyltransferase